MALAGKVALVTGAGTRVGRAIALELGRQGMRVAVHYHSSEAEAARTCQQIEAVGGSAQAFNADLYDRAAARGLVDKSVEYFGQLDLLVSSAANFERVPFGELDDAAWDRAMQLNTATSFALAERASAKLKETRGSMVFITCSSTVTPFRNYLPYVVSKAALLQLVRVLALELAPEVRVNAVAPGTVLPPEAMTEEQLAQLRRKIPLGRFGSAEEIARATAFLADSDFITGQQIVVDGGRSVAAIEAYSPGPKE
jgi:pteridine reductase